MRRETFTKVGDSGHSVLYCNGSEHYRFNSDDMQIEAPILLADITPCSCTHKLDSHTNDCHTTDSINRKETAVLVVNCEECPFYAQAEVECSLGYNQTIFDEATVYDFPFEGAIDCFTGSTDCRVTLVKIYRGAEVTNLALSRYMVKQRQA